MKTRSILRHKRYGVNAVHWIRPISYVLPLTYGVDILKTAINGNGIIASGLCFTVLIGFSLFLFLFSIRNIKHKWIY